MKLRATFLDIASLGPDDIDLSGLEAELPGISFHARTAPEELAARIAGHEVVLVNKVRLDARTLENARGLRLVCVAATGTDNVDLAAARRLGIAVCNIRDYCTQSVVQHVFAMVLYLNQQLAGYRSLVQRGEWSAGEDFCLLDHRFGELAGRTLGIVGWGRLGQAVGALGQALGMEVIAAHSRISPDVEAGVRRLPLAGLLDCADVLSLHCPLTPETSGLINSRTLAMMKPEALLVNTARGGLVDSQALLVALQRGRIAGAGIDVLTEEPPPADEPLLAADLPNLLVTPHIAWAAREARQRAVDQMVENLRAWQNGKRVRRVD
ncbi:MAG: D-2-hydroxyacid dehydrogenase [Chromatiales bacterium]|nr:D-2-hydroxyacid dehydrogenase [Chromatiales bacterium]